MTDNITTGGTPGRGRIRAGDEDRDRAVERLRLHHGAGRLDAGEFNERMETALGARYLDELPPLLADLPGEGRADDGPRLFGGGPPWAGPRHDRRGGDGDRADDRVGHRAGDWRHRWTVVPVVPILLVLVIVGSVAAIAHGHFPFPLLWVALLLFWLRPWGRVPWGRGWGRARR